MASETAEPAQPAGSRLCRYADTRHYLWGDDVSGRIKDWYYAGSREIHMSMWSMPPGSMFRHSDEHKSYYWSDEAYLILQGEITIHNPETGDVAVVRAGEGLHFREKTWHYGYNFTQVETVLIGLLAPVPPDISSAAELAAMVPPLEQVRNHRDDLLGNFPWNAGEAARTSCFQVLEREHWLHTVSGVDRPIRVDLLQATDRLTAGQFDLPPGFQTDPERHPGDEVAFCTSGQAAVQLLDSGEWFELHERDGCFISAGEPHRWFNTTGQPASVFFGVAPKYL